MFNLPKSKAEQKRLLEEYAKIQQAQKKYGIKDYRKLLAKMQEMGDFGKAQTSPMSKTFGLYDNTLEELRVMPKGEFADALEEMTDGEVEEVIFYLANTSEKQEQIREIKMERTTKKILDFDMPEFEDQEEEQQQEQEPPPSYNPEQRKVVKEMQTLLSPGLEDEPMLEFPESMRQGMGQLMWDRAKEQQREARKQAWEKKKQAFIDKYGSVSTDNMNEFRRKVPDYETYLRFGGGDDE